MRWLESVYLVCSRASSSHSESKMYENIQKNTYNTPKTQNLRCYRTVCTRWGQFNSSFLISSSFKNELSTLNHFFNLWLHVTVVAITHHSPVMTTMAARSGKHRPPTRSRRQPMVALLAGRIARASFLRGATCLTLLIFLVCASMANIIIRGSSTITEWRCTHSNKTQFQQQCWLIRHPACNEHS